MINSGATVNQITNARDGVRVSFGREEHNALCLKTRFREGGSRSQGRTGDGKGEEGAKIYSQVRCGEDR